MAPMLRRFALTTLLLATAAGCAHRETLPETTATPTYREQDLLEATAGIGGHRSMDERVTLLESQVKAMRVELGRVSGTTQRLEARQLQTVGVTPEPVSKAATPIGKAAKHKPEAPTPPDAASTPAVDPRDPWAGAAPATPKAAEASGPKKEERAKEEKVASAAPASEAAHAPAAEAAPAPAAAETAPGAVGFAIQLAAYGTAERAASSWEELKSRGGPLLADLLPKREEASQGGKTVYRLKAGPLPDRDAATKRCDALKAQNIPCLVTLFSGDWPSS